MVYLGKISYGIYLIHAFMREIVYRIFDYLGLPGDKSPLAIAFFSTVATIIAATVTWHVLERPINDLKRFFQYADKVPQASVSYHLKNDTSVGLQRVIRLPCGLLPAASAHCVPLAW